MARPISSANYFSEKQDHWILQIITYLGDITCNNLLINDSLYLITRSMFELWGWGRDYKELETAIKKLPPDVMVCTIPH